MSDRKLNQAGVDLIRGEEGLRLNAYIDDKYGKVWTIGYGHTGDDVYEGLEITEEQADMLWVSDTSDAMRAVDKHVVVDITDNQFAALVSLVFNIGAGVFKSSTLLKLLNAGDYAGAAGQFGRWTHDNGVQLRGLVKRRARERDLFLSEDLS